MRGLRIIGACVALAGACSGDESRVERGSRAEPDDGSDPDDDGEGDEGEWFFGAAFGGAGVRAGLEAASAWVGGVASRIRRFSSRLHPWSRHSNRPSVVIAAT